MKYTFSTDLSVDGINRIIKEIDYYKDTQLPVKVGNFVEKLSELGVWVAKVKVNDSTYAPGKVVISRDVKDSPDGCQAILYATETGIITSEWVTKDGTVHTVDVSPLLMVEFGSGKLAQSTIKYPNGLEVGRGTFPNQKHAFDADGWWWMDRDGVWHHSYGMKPTRPLNSAMTEMWLNIVKVAKETFY